MDCFVAELQPAVLVVNDEGETTNEGAMVLDNKNNDNESFVPIVLLLKDGGMDARCDALTADEELDDDGAARGCIFQVLLAIRLA